MGRNAGKMPLSPATVLAACDAVCAELAEGFPEVPDPVLARIVQIAAVEFAGAITEREFTSQLRRRARARLRAATGEMTPVRGVLPRPPVPQKIG